jgi:hypothetical protein
MKSGCVSDRVPTLSPADRDGGKRLAMQAVVICTPDPISGTSRKADDGISSDTRVTLFYPKCGSGQLSRLSGFRMSTLGQVCAMRLE